MMNNNLFDMSMGYGSMMQEKPKNQPSYNSYSFEYPDIVALLDYTIHEHELNMPPSKATLSKLFDILNLEVSPIKIIDCLVYSRGKRMESSNPTDFNIKRLH
mmetsp:Transcript_26965/g.41091  ORF Transcript_26965/g.41091 Transcript_26965/m.41091 type:complete len:102 (+) Transcript_26965:176-481(+)